MLTPLLTASGYAVRLASRGTSPPVDLVSGAGAVDAVRDIDVVVHLATTNGRRDVAMMRILCRGALDAGGDRLGPNVHLPYLSIVGCDEVPLPYYRHKTEAEQVALNSGLPVTILRSTQFHSLVALIFASQRRLPALVVPDIPMQPIDLADVASREMLELVGGPAAGRVADIGGPQTAPLDRFRAAVATGSGSAGACPTRAASGRTFAAYRAGRHTVPGTAYGRTATPSARGVSIGAFGQRAFTAPIAGPTRRGARRRRPSEPSGSTAVPDAPGRGRR